MRISAKADYAVRAAVEMAAAGDEPVKGEKLAEAQDIPLQFLEHILLELKHARLVRARRGARGGYWLAQPPEEITLASVIRAVEGPLANIQDQAPEQTKYPGNAEQLSEVWIAVRASLRRVLENVTIADLRDGKIPADVLELPRTRAPGLRTLRLGNVSAARSKPTQLGGKGGFRYGAALPLGPFRSKREQGGKAAFVQSAASTDTTPKWIQQSSSSASAWASWSA